MKSQTNYKTLRIHDDAVCEKYHKYYKNRFDQELSDCEYKENKSKIQKLLRKVQIDANGIATEIQFDNLSEDEWETEEEWETDEDECD